MTRYRASLLCVSDCVGSHARLVGVARRRLGRLPIGVFARYFASSVALACSSHGLGVVFFIHVYVIGVSVT